VSRGKIFQLIFAYVQFYHLTILRNFVFLRAVSSHRPCGVSIQPHSRSGVRGQEVLRLQVSHFGFILSEIVLGKIWVLFFALCLIY